MTPTMRLAWWMILAESLPLPLPLLRVAAARVAAAPARPRDLRSAMAAPSGLRQQAVMDTWWVEPTCSRNASFWGHRSYQETEL